MIDKKPEVRNIPIFCIEVTSDKTAFTSRGEYRATLDFSLPCNGERPRVFRMRVSPSDISYLRECLDTAEDKIRSEFESSF